MTHSPSIPAQDLSFGVDMRAASCQVKAGTELWSVVDWVMREIEMSIQGQVSVYRVTGKLSCLQTKKLTLDWLVSLCNVSLPEKSALHTCHSECHYSGLICSSVYLFIFPLTHSFTYLSAVLLLNTCRVLDPALSREGTVDEEGALALRGVYIYNTL